MESTLYIRTVSSTCALRVPVRRLMESGTCLRAGLAWNALGALPFPSTLRTCAQRGIRYLHMYLCTSTYVNLALLSLASEADGPESPPKDSPWHADHRLPVLANPPICL